jgi:tRNA U34 5-methylaminomethyl-2-thiouridine-forming methyltransferase MnmC
MFGAISESEHVFIRNGFCFCTEDQVNIFEVGFGTGLNALLTAIKAMDGKKEVFYTAIEKYPVENEIVKMLNYPSFTGETGRRIFDEIHSCEWGKSHRICENFSLIKINGDLTKEQPEGFFNLIYFDAFGPDKQPEMWSMNVFNKISRITSVNGIFVTYSAKGEVKRNLEGCGFKVSRIPGPPGKREMIRAIKF